MTFTEDLPAGLQRVHNIMHDRAVTGSGAILKGFLKFVFPFVRTPYNIFKTGIRKTPLGSIRLATKVGAGLVDAWKGNQPFFKSYERAALAGDIAEQILGWGVALLLAGMAEGDPDDDKKALLITGTRSSTDNRGEDQLLKRTRGGETTILWHGKPVFNYGRIEPFSTVISTLVDAMRELKRIKGGEPAAKAVEHAMRDLVDQARSKTFLSGLDGLMTLLNGQNKGLPDMAAKAIATGIVPNLVRQTLRNTDDRARDTRNAPLLYQALPWGGWAEPLFDLYGREIVKDGSAAYRVLANDGNAKIQPINPADVALEKWNKATEGDPVQQYYPVNPSVFRTKGPDGNYRAMTPKEIAAFRKRAGQEFGAAARGNFANPNMPTLTEMRRLRSLKDETYDRTKKAMFPQPPSLASLFLRK